MCAPRYGAHNADSRFPQLDRGRLGFHGVPSPEGIRIGFELEKSPCRPTHRHGAQPRLALENMLL